MIKDLQKVFYLLRTFVDKKAIGYLILFVTARCNYHCRMCFYWQQIKKSDRPTELSLKEIAQISQKIRLVEHLSITGGEPFMRNDVAAIAKCFFDNCRLQSLTIVTNGFFKDKIVKTAEELASAYPDKQIRICLSIDELEKFHDQIRGVKGAFKKMAETHDCLIRIRKKHHNLVVDANTVFSSYNQNRIIEIINFINNNFQFDNHYLSLVRGNPREPEAKKVNLEKYREAISLIEKNSISQKKRKDIIGNLFWGLKLAIREIVYRTASEKKKIVPCFAGTKMVEISESGEVPICEILEKSLGNLRKTNYDLYQLLSSPRAKKIIKKNKTSSCFCHFECAVQTGVVYSPRFYPQVAKYLLAGFLANHEK